MFGRCDDFRGCHEADERARCKRAIADAIREAVAAERERLKAVLTEIGRLTRWAELLAGPTGGVRTAAAEDMRRIKELAEAETGLAFAEYT